MTILAIRQKLMTYIADADDSKVKALYTLLENDMDEDHGFTLSDEQLQILEKEQELYLKGEGKSYTVEESFQTIRDQNPNNGSLIENILDKKFVIISIIGSHAGDEISNIFSWKSEEIKRNKKTYWLIRSSKAQTIQIQKFCEQAQKEGENVYCLFVTASGKNAARPTTTEILVKEISENKIDWFMLSDSAKIKGKVDLQSTALVLSELKIFDIPKQVDLHNYSEVDVKQNIIPVNFRLGASTSCCKKITSIGMKSNLRTIVAYAKLDIPYAVWVR